MTRNRSDAVSRLWAFCAVASLGLAVSCGSTAVQSDATGLPQGDTAGMTGEPNGLRGPTGQDVGGGELTPQLGGGVAAGTGGTDGRGKPAGRAGAPTVSASVKKEPLRVGFIGADNLDKFGDAFGGTDESAGPQFGSTTALIHAFVNYVNSHGGVAGRKIVPVIRNSDVTSADPQSDAQAMCTGFAQDDKVFAVVAVSAGVSGVLPHCFAQHRIPFVTSSFFSFTNDYFRRVAPYYWNASSINLSDVARLMARNFHERGFYRGGKLGVWYEDSGEFVNTYTKVLKPELARLGVRIEGEMSFPQFTYASVGEISAQCQNAVLQFKAAGIDRVIILDNVGTITLFCTSEAAAQQYLPRYGLTSNNQPQALAEGGGDLVAGSIGFGWSPAADVANQQYPWPSRPAEKLCAQIAASEGQRYDRRVDALLALGYCDSIFLFQRAAAGISELTARAWAAGAQSLTSVVPSAIGFGTMFRPGKFDGGLEFRDFKYVSSCTCMMYEPGFRRRP